MYLIVVYDVKTGRTNKPRKFLRQNLQHIQNSVFEGEVTKGQSEKIISELEKMAKEDESIIIYKLRSDNVLDRKFFGGDSDPMEGNKFI